MIDNCPKCNHHEKTKDGFVNQTQRYKCKKCDYRFTVVSKDAKTASIEIKRMALQMYLEWLGFRSISKFLNFSHVAVYQWIKAFGSQVKDLRTKNSPITMEIDEMHSYIGSKKTLAGYGLLLIDMEKDLSILTLANEIQKQGKDCGTKSNQRPKTL